MSSDINVLNEPLTGSKYSTSILSVLYCGYLGGVIWLMFAVNRVDDFFVIIHKRHWSLLTKVSESANNTVGTVCTILLHELQYLKCVNYFIIFNLIHIFVSINGIK